MSACRPTTSAEIATVEKVAVEQSPSSLDGEFTRGVLERCDDCGRQTVVQAVMDPDDPLDWVIEGWQCRPCSFGVEVDDD